MLPELPEGSMFRSLLRLALLVIVLAAAVAFFMGYRYGGHTDRPSERPVATTGTGRPCSRNIRQAATRTA